MAVIREYLKTSDLDPAKFACSASGLTAIDTRVISKAGAPINGTDTPNSLDPSADDTTPAVLIDTTNDAVWYWDPVDAVWFQTYLLPDYYAEDLLPYDEDSVIYPLNGVEHPAGTTYSILAGTDVSLNSLPTIRPDGGHTVSPSPASCGTGKWEYQMRATFPDGSTDDAYVRGTVDNEQISWSGMTTNTAGGVIHSVRIGLLVTGNTWDIDWGDGTVVTGLASNAETTHVYAAPYAGPVTISYAKCDSITNVINGGLGGDWDYDIADLPDTTLYYLASYGTITGDLSTLPDGLLQLQLTGQNTVTGDIGTLPSTLTNFVLQGQNTTSGDIANLPAGLINYNNLGQNTTTGDIGNLPAGLTNYTNQGQNTTSGDIGNLPAGLTWYANTGQNTTSGLVDNLPTGVTYYYNFGQNTTSGDIGNLPAGLTQFYNGGQNTTSGLIDNLPAGLIRYYNLGQNTTSGLVDNLPAGLTFYINGGQNTTSGLVDNLPAGLTQYTNSGQNTVGGLVDNLPASLTNFQNLGNNTVGGLIDNMPAGLSYFYNLGANTIKSAGGIGATTMNFFYHNSTVALTSGEVDTILVALTNVTTWIGSRRVEIIGAAAAPGPVGLAAIPTILANGAALVNTN